METVLEQHQAPAGLVQEEGGQHVKFYCSEHHAAGEGTSSTSAADESAVGDSWGQEVEEEYININEAVDADLLSYDNTGTVAPGCISESSSDEAAAEEEADMTEDISSDTAMDTTTACAISSAATPLDTSGESVSCAAASDDCIDLSAANSETCSTADQSSRVRTSLEFVLKGARDAICCAAVGSTSVCGNALSSTEQQHQQVEPVLLAALGSCDDACRLYVLPPATQQQQQHVSADINAYNSLNSGGSSNSTSSRSGQKRTGRRDMEAMATLREGHETISAAAFSSDSKLLACGCFDGVVRVYRPRVTRASGTGKASTPPPQERRGVDQVSAELQGTASFQPEPLNTTEQQVREAVSAAHPTALEEERDRKASYEDKVEMSVDVAEELRGCAADVVDLSFHPRGYALLVASADQTAWVWLLPVSLVNVSNLNEAAGIRRAAVLTVYAAAAPLTCCCFSSSGREGIVGAVDGTVSVFTAKTGALLYAVKHPGLSLSLRQRQHQHAEEPCSVVTLRLSSTCVSHPACVPTAAHGGTRAAAAAAESGCGSVSLAVGSCVSAVEGTALKTESLTNEKEQHEDVLLGVGYENGWVALVREAAGDVIFAEQGHAQKAVESITFVRVAAGTRTTAARGTEGRAGSGGCHLFISGGLDGRVLIWDVAHKCVRAAVATAVAAPVAEVGRAVNGAELQRELMAAAGVTRLLVLQGYLLGVCDIDMYTGMQQLEVTQEHQWLQQQQMRRPCAQQQEQQEAVLVCAGSTDGHLFVLDVRAGQLLHHWQAHAGAVMDLTALPAAGATPAKEQGAVAVPVVRPGGGGEEEWPNLSLQEHAFHRRCCCWRVLSAGDDGIGKVWRIVLS